VDYGKGESFYNRSLERALQILIAFGGERKPLTLAQLSELLALSKATALRLCSTLVKYGFLRQDQESRQYFLGLRLFELGSIVLSSFSLRKAASPYLTQLQVKFGKAVFLGVLDEGDLLYIDKREDAEVGISFPSNIGRRRPPYWGMLGPALMAFLPDDEIERLLERSPFQKTAKKSFTEVEDFKEWLHTIREQGFLVEGIGGIGAPVRDHTGNVVAAVGVGFISSSADSKTLKKMVKEVISTANAISKELGFQADQAWDKGADW
jgi:IclR family KDG regulon transcriptional repressor